MDKLFSLDELQDIINGKPMYVWTIGHLAQQLLDTMRENERLREALQIIVNFEDGKIWEGCPCPSNARYTLQQHKQSVPILCAGCGKMAKSDGSCDCMIPTQNPLDTNKE